MDNGYRNFRCSFRCPVLEDLSVAERTTYRIDLQYDGTDFAGWQLQPDVRTVQGCLEDAVQVLFQERATVLAAGRTDAGVHATGQVAHVRTVNVRPVHDVLFGLNSNLPSDVRLQRVEIADTAFHARHSAKWRGYVYRIATAPVAVGRAYCWQSPFELDIDAMRAGSQLLLGSHSFRAYAHEAKKESHYLSDVYQAEWTSNGEFLEFRIHANRFLHGMVRLLVGTLVTVGRGKLEPGAISEILRSEDVRRSGQKAPASGLTLEKVGYLPWPSG